MTKHRAIELLRIEKECILRNKKHICDRDCNECDLVQDPVELLEMYDFVLAEMEQGE